jgi:hypothetical protein
MAPEPVECHSGYTYGERPQAFVWEGQRLVIAQIEGRWRLPDGRRFRVRTHDGRLFDLSYYEQGGRWQIDEL